MAVRYVFCIIFWCISSFPNQLSHKILLSKNFIHQQPQVMHLVVVNGNENHAILAQQVFGKIEARHHHIQPVAVVLPVFFGVFAEHPFAGHVAVMVLVAHTLLVLFLAFREFIGIDEAVIAGVVRGVYVDHLHLTEVALLQQKFHLILSPIRFFTMNANGLGLGIIGIFKRLFHL